MTLYTDLNVPPDADRETLTRAHRKAVRKHHPDAGGDREQFERVQRAWLILSNPTKRERYDQTGATEDRPDNELSALTGMIVRAFDRAFEQAPDPGRVDIIGKAASILTQDAAQARDVLNEAKAVKSKLAAAAKRLRFKGKGVDVLALVIEERQRDIARRIVAIQQEAAQIARAVEHLKLYGWDFERGQGDAFRPSALAMDDLARFMGRP